MKRNQYSNHIKLIFNDEMNQSNFKWQRAGNFFESRHKKVQPQQYRFKVLTSLGDMKKDHNHALFRDGREFSGSHSCVSIIPNNGRAFLFHRSIHILYLRLDLRDIAVDVLVDNFGRNGHSAIAIRVDNFWRRFVRLVFLTGEDLHTGVDDLVKGQMQLDDQDHQGCEQKGIP